MKITFFFSNDIALTYLLNNTITASNWLHMMQKVTPMDMSRNEENHRHGFAQPDEIKIKIEKLKQCCKSLAMPNVDLAANHWQDWQAGLNKIHTAFPSTLWSGVNSELAHTSNLLIHWLEYELSNTFDNAQQYLFNLDFNHKQETYELITQIPEDEMCNFTTDIYFGVLNLHYIFIGRHFLEMFNAKDFISPRGHFRPQWFHNATCAVNFSERQHQASLHEKMRKFYNDKGGKRFFGLDFNDVRLAKGFFKLGELENITDFTLERREELRQKLATAHVTHWEVFDKINNNA